MPTDAPPAVVDAIGLRREFVSAAERVVAVDDVDLTVERGTLTVLAGPSGSGKSTLLRMIACLDRPDAGSLCLESRAVHELGRRARRALRRHRIGIVHPAPARNLINGLDVGANIELARRLRGGLATVDVGLDAVGLAGRDRARVPELSNGEQLRLGLAIALVGGPALVAADEPTASLDATTAVAIAALLRELVSRGTTLLVATHDAHIIDMADAVVRLDHGRRRV